MGYVSRHHALIFMVLCLLLASALRLPQLRTIPPGLHYDEAANGTLAADIGLRGERPIFISSYTGKEPLFFYLAGGLMYALGDSPFVLRLTAAFLGLLTVAATYSLGRELLASRRVALFAAALLAISFWHLLFSRLGFRAITQPLLQALTLWAFIRGLRRHEKRWLFSSGLFLGLTAYTYLAARLFPLLFLIALIPLISNRHAFQLRWRQLFLVGCTALVVLAPLLGYFVVNPEAFWVRINQVSSEAGEASLGLGQSYLRSLQMLFLTGDPYWRFNVPQKPIFDWFWGGLLVLGWGGLVIRWRHLAADWRRMGSLFLILAPFIMILPTALATMEIVPSNLRAIGLAPFIFYLPAVGMATLSWELEARFQVSATILMPLLIGLLILISGGFITRQTYFQVWATQPALYYESDGDLTEVARFVDELDIVDTPIYLSALHYRHPTMAFLSHRYDEIHWLVQSEALVLPAGGSGIYIYPRNSPVPSWASPFLETGDRLNSIPGPDGQLAFEAFELAEPPAMIAPTPVNANFDDVITLLGYEIESVAAGDVMSMMLYWQVNQKPAAAYTPFVHLLDGWGHRWSQVEEDAYPAEQWLPGDRIIQHVSLPVPSGAPPGTYRLRIGLFVPGIGDRLPRLDENGRYAGDAYAVESVLVTAGDPPDELPQPPFVSDQPILPGLRLLGYERGGDKATTGELYPLALWWSATTTPPWLSTRLELMRADGRGRILINTQPVHDTYPFHQWQAPQFVIDHVDPRIPESFPPGNYRLQLRLMDGDDKTLLTADLGPLTLERTERVFTPPKMKYLLSATFGDEIDLLGYNLEPAAEGIQYQLSLVWQARTRPTADYTVFVHLLQMDGSCDPCVWQQDVMPRQNQYPTGRWLAHEVVVDIYQILLPEALPAGEYAMEVGLYIAENGRRLQVTQPNQNTADAVNLHRLRVER